MALIPVRIHLTFPEVLTLHHTRRGSTDLPAGDYVAKQTPPDEDGKIYELYRADSNWNAVGVKLANVGITIDAAGIAIVS